ncbi:MAG: UDP-N-acetylmuramate dehydrogenase [Bacteroidaceae bacterium]|nr:UDP-N-acetylmuramate dehydrogenase [Bacteroidaceae bacterium]
MLTIKTNYSLKAHNSFGLDVKARYFVEYETAEDLAEFLSSSGTLELSNFGTLELFHIGSGSDLLFTKDFDGYILHSAVKGIEKLDEREGRVLLRVGAAENWDEFVAWTIAHGYYGLENLSLIPSEVGAAAVQNIGAYGAEAKDFIVSVDCVDMHTGQPVRHTNGECGFSYRRSNYKEQWCGQFAITHVIFSLPTEFEPNIRYKGLSDLPTDGLTAQDVRNKVIELRRSKLPEPSQLGNAGSFFLNPIITAEHFDSLLQQYPDIPHYPAAGNTLSSMVKVSAAWLIEKAGWKGRSLGRAGVYHNQPLVLVNLGGATPDEIVALAAAIVKDVEQMFGIALKPEVIYLE